ncbi:MAG: M23 family metallopeptidase [Patescibacteria group bacterium]
MGSLLAILIVPLLARAAFFSFSSLLNSTAEELQASGTPLNSQTMPLLTPEKNIQPPPASGGADITVVDGSALLADGSVLGNLVETSGVSNSGQISVYTVREGDTLSEIAEMYNVSVSTIAGANRIERRVIHPGQELIILPITGVQHVVAKGDTLASIAKKYKGDLEDIASYNELATDAALTVGETIIVPNGVIEAPPAPRSSGSTAAVRSAGGPPVAQGYYGWPVDGGVVTQGIHGYNGIDIGARTGTSIFAAAAGTVIVARSGGYNGGYGSYVVVKHDNGTQTLYAHASAVLVSVGEQVSKGQPIAKVGSTGRSTGNHLHFEVRGAANPFRR